MSQNETLANLLDELDQTHVDAYYQSDAFRTNHDFPDFTTAANGEVRNFYRPARELLASLSASIFEMHADFNRRIDEKRFAELTRKAVADLHASEAFIGAAKPLKVLVDELKKRVDQASQTFTHSFPAWTCGIEEDGEFIFGQVTFMTWPQWLTHVEFAEEAQATIFNEPEANARWKELLLEAMENGGASAPAGLAGLFVGAVTSCPAVLRVEVDGLEKSLSRKLAEIVCKGALDSVSLLIDQRESFVQQALQVERLPPIRIDRIIESEGNLCLIERSLTNRIPSLRGASIKQFLKDSSSQLHAMAHAINGLIDRSHPHPLLASRWATALDWYAEGQRERSDAIALAKIGTSLDVLSSGGMYPGILELLKNLLCLPEDVEFSRGTEKTTLKKMVKEIYNSGRSQILHGTRHDRMEAFERERNAAAFLARLALIEAAMRLEVYTGIDDEKAFRTMPARTPQDIEGTTGAV